MSTRRQKVKCLANKLLRAYKLDKEGWHFQYHRGRTPIWLGLCQFQYKRIKLNPMFVDCSSMDRIIDTLLHEVAHALTRDCYNHGWHWKMKCMEVGCEPRSTTLLDETEFAFTVFCPKCPIQISMFTAPKGQYVCPGCHIPCWVMDRRL